MKEKLRYIETENKKYPICFNLNVMEEIQEQYGSMSKWGELVESKVDGEPRVKDLKIGLMIMINEGIDIENENADVKQELLNTKQVGRIIGEIGFTKLTETIKEITVASTKTENNSKNE